MAGNNSQLSEERQIQWVDVEHLHFDPENPRLPSSLDGSDEQVVLNWMVADATLIELMGAIGEVGFFPAEPLLVVQVNSTGNYYVIEGNRRLAAVKLLNNPDLISVRQRTIQQVSAEAVHKPKRVPVIEFEHRTDVLHYLGYRHITGVKPWSPLAKARYIKDLLQKIVGEETENKYQILAKAIGSRSDYVERLLAGLEVYERISEEYNFFNIPGLSEQSINFSLLTTALGYGNILGFIGLESNRDRSLSGLQISNLEELASWIFQENSEGYTRLGESRNLKRLNNVVASEEAIAAFRQGRTLQEADMLAGSPTEIFRAAVNQSLIELQRARDYLHLVNDFTPTDSGSLKDIWTIARQIRIAVDDQLLEQEMNR